MNYTILKKIPTREELRRFLPLTPLQVRTVKKNRHDIQQILNGNDHRLVVIVGPCSAWPKEAVLEYARRLAKLKEIVSPQLNIVMRVYSQKPRTTTGWMGSLYQPDVQGDPDISAGLHYVRDMMIKIIEMDLAIADEAVFIHAAQGLEELLSWVAIGARSSESQEHRIAASAFECPVGLKNPTHGALSIAVNGVLAAQQSHVMILEGHEVKTAGNLFAHLVLRGGEQHPNYGLPYLQAVYADMLLKKIHHPGVIIDVSHDNCRVNGQKNHHRQPDIIFEILRQLQPHARLKSFVKGFMIESFIKGGNQKLQRDGVVDETGLSITDPCIDWEQTERLLLRLADEHHATLG